MAKDLADYALAIVGIIGGALGIGLIALNLHNAYRANRPAPAPVNVPRRAPTYEELYNHYLNQYQQHAAGVP